MSAAPPRDGAAAAAPAPNWLSEWAGRTPVVCRALIYVALGASLVSWVTGVSGWLILVPSQAVLHGQVWRLATGVLCQDGFLTLLFVVIGFAVQMPPVELRLGSAPYLATLASSALAVNVAFALVSCALAAIPWAPLRGFGETPAHGLWAVLMMFIAINAFADPQGTTPFFCWRFGNKIYPWVLPALFSLISFFPQLDLFMGVGLGYACAWSCFMVD